MCAAVGYPVLRLVRSSIEGLRLEGLHPGDCVEMEQKEFYDKLKLNR
jgi:16S rRNA U516 pseudouridylate synthase RsuA-like enzyme